MAWLKLSGNLWQRYGNPTRQIFAGGDLRQSAGKCRRAEGRPVAQVMTAQNLHVNAPIGAFAAGL
jgi:hypothetical protein